VTTLSSDGSSDGAARAVRVATDFLDRILDRVPAVIGIGTVAVDAAGVADARAGADRALRVLRSSTGGRRRVARLADVHVEALVLELRDLVAARGNKPTGAAARLAEVGGIDLTDPDARFSAMLQLRVFTPPSTMDD
jgi:hypothetical protein